MTAHSGRAEEGKRHLADGPRLTPAERNFLFLTKLGQSPREIAVTLDLSLHEVQQSLAQLQRRFGVASHRKLMLLALLNDGGQSMR